MRVRVARLLDLTQPGLLARLGASDDDLVSDEFTVCQAIGGAAAYLEVDGLLVPSTRSDGANLVILFVDTEPSPAVEVIETERLPM